MNFTPHKYLLKSKHAFWNGVPLVSMVTHRRYKLPKTFILVFKRWGNIDFHVSPIMCPAVVPLMI